VLAIPMVLAPMKTFMSSTQCIIFSLALSICLLGCQDEYGFSSKSDGQQGSQTFDSGEDTREPEPPSPRLGEECPDGAHAVLSEEMVVLSWDPTTSSGILTAPASGIYHLYDFSIVESGASQTNESAYLRIPSIIRPGGTPFYSNCNEDWVIVDADNDSALPLTSRIYVGTFWLDTGDNPVTLHHYCPLYRAGACQNLHIPDDAEATCESGNVNSVHFLGQGICLIPEQ
jgi:hypothetical protein